MNRVEPAMLRNATYEATPSTSSQLAYVEVSNRRILHCMLDGTQPRLAAATLQDCMHDRPNGLHHLAGLAGCWLELVHLAVVVRLVLEGSLAYTLQ